MSDIHGNYDKYMKMLEEIEFGKDDTLYVLGDVVDRGPRAFDIIKHIMKNENIHMLLGNHEDYLISRITAFGYHGDAYDNGMSHDSVRKLRRIEQRERFDILMFLRNLPIYKFIEINGEKILLVHAGIATENPDNTNRDFMLWARDEFLFSGPDFPFQIIHGHTPVQSVFGWDKKTVWKYRNRINIDCGAPFEHGYLACLRLEDKKEFYI